MAIERIIGIDFGTSTSVIRIKRYENGKPVGEKRETKEVIFSGIGSTVPTLIQKKDDDESIVYYGYEAQQKRKKTTTYHSFKVDLESSDPEKRALARKLTEEFFCYLAKIYKAQSMGGYLGEPGDKERTIVSYPVKWSNETRQFMIEAARKAGFPDVSGMEEAQAAIQAVTVMSEDHLRKKGLLVNGMPSNILLIDMGVAATNMVLCRYFPGEEAKVEIVNVCPRNGEMIFGGKEVDILLDYCLNRSIFEDCLSSYLKDFPQLINGCLTYAGINSRDVDLVIVTGGHSQWYFVKEMLAGKMPQYGKLELTKIMADPSRIIQITRPQETVALGLVCNMLCPVFVETRICANMDNSRIEEEMYKKKAVEASGQESADNATSAKKEVMLDGFGRFSVDKKEGSLRIL